MEDSAILLLIALLLPLLGAAVVWAVAPLGTIAVRWVALAFTSVSLVLALMLSMRFPADNFAGDFAVFSMPWFGDLGSLDVQFALALDGLSLWLFTLAALLSFVSVLVSWESIQDRPAGFYALILLLETGMLGVFAARDIILFYVFFEFTLIPLFFIIGIWGSEERRRAAVRFFLYTFAGSVFTFLGLLAIALWHYYNAGSDAVTFSIPELTAWLTLNPIDPTAQVAIFLALFAGFAIKVPLFPFHTWLPLAHVQAPTAGSVLLAGVLLKIGTYGFLRFSLPLLPAASAFFMPWILGLSLGGIIYGALAALAQKDMKRLIAYSSVSHLGFCMLGLFTLNRLGLSGGLLQMITHGLSTGGLFAVVGMLYERYHTREIADLGGIARRMPILAFFMVVLTLASIGLPGLGGFAGEILLLAGAFQRGWNELMASRSANLLIIAVLSVSGVILGAWYMLWLVQRVFFGPLREPARTADEHAVEDLCWREILALTPLTVLSVWIGVQPSYFLRPVSPWLNNLAGRVEVAASQESHALFATQTTAMPEDSSKSFVPEPTTDTAVREFRYEGDFNSRIERKFGELSLEKPEAARNSARLSNLGGQIVH